MHRQFTGLLLTLFVLQCGCSGAGSIGEGTMKTLRPRAFDYDDGNDAAFVDTWGEAGSIGRGDRPLEPTYDGFPWGSSKARAIERNVGFDTQ